MWWGERLVDGYRVLRAARLADSEHDIDFHGGVVEAAGMRFGGVERE